jgi:crotonobetainyl-CoA:carnitine CoA-transferase CaiB-like acyl-CoA transferase
LTTTSAAESATAAALTGVRVVTIATNIPGPLAAARLRELGASVTKVEPPNGDYVGQAAPGYYEELAAGQTVVTLDLKTDEGRADLDRLLGEADVFITSHRTSALRRLGLDWDSVRSRYPRLCQVSIVGHPAPDDDVPGHDLTYQAVNGTLPIAPGPSHTPLFPTVLIADLAGAERAATAAVALLVARGRTGGGGFAEVALSDAVHTMSGPLRHGLTAPGGPLAGAHPGYQILETATGFVACAALEPHFLARLTSLLDVSPDRNEIATAFRQRSAEHWVAWGREHDVPIEAVREP